LKVNNIYVVTWYLIVAIIILLLGPSVLPILVCDNFELEISEWEMKDERDGRWEKNEIYMVDEMISHIVFFLDWFTWIDWFIWLFDNDVGLFGCLSIIPLTAPSQSSQSTPSQSVENHKEENDEENEIWILGQEIFKHGSK